MRPQSILIALVALVGFLLPVEPAGGAADAGGASLRPGRELPAWPAEPGNPQLRHAAPGGEPAPASASEGRAKGQKRDASGGPPASPTRALALSCPPPAARGGSGPLPPGESPPAQAFLRVNGSANAHGARA